MLKGVAGWCNRGSPGVRWGCGENPNPGVWWWWCGAVLVRWWESGAVPLEGEANMPRGAQSPRRVQSVYVGGCRPTSPDLVLVPAEASPPTPRERHAHAVVVPRPVSLASDAQAAAYLYSCHAPYAR